jgi:hypothetical protein
VNGMMKRAWIFAAVLMLLLLAHSLIVPRDSAAYHFNEFEMELWSAFVKAQNREQ